MVEKKLMTLFLLLSFALFLSFSCTSAKNTGEAIKEGTTEAAEEVVDKTEDAGEEIADKAEDVGQEIEDGTITSAIKMSFANDELVSASAIDVDTSDGHVTLNGTVESQTEAERAIEIAKKVDGVKSVRSNLNVRS